MASEQQADLRATTSYEESLLEAIVDARCLVATETQEARTKLDSVKNRLQNNPLKKPRNELFLRELDLAQRAIQTRRRSSSSSSSSSSSMVQDSNDHGDSPRELRQLLSLCSPAHIAAGESGTLAQFSTQNIGLSEAAQPHVSRFLQGYMRHLTCPSMGRPHLEALPSETLAEIEDFAAAFAPDSVPLDALQTEALASISRANTTSGALRKLRKQFESNRDSRPEESLVLSLQSAIADIDPQEAKERLLLGDTPILTKDAVAWLLGGTALLDNKQRDLVIRVSNVDQDNLTLRPDRMTDLMIAAAERDTSRMKDILDGITTDRTRAIALFEARDILGQTVFDWAIRTRANRKCQSLLKETWKQIQGSSQPSPPHGIHTPSRSTLRDALRAGHVYLTERIANGSPGKIVRAAAREATSQNNRQVNRMARITAARALCAMKSRKPRLNIDTASKLSTTRGWTLLHLLAATKHTRHAAKLLIDHGANPNRATTASGITPLHIAVLSVCDAETVKLLLDSGAMVNIEDHSGWTPLHIACRYGTSAAMVKLLLKRGAQVDRRTLSGLSPLSLAHRNKTEAKDEILTLLRTFVDDA